MADDTTDRMMRERIAFFERHKNCHLLTVDEKTGAPLEALYYSVEGMVRKDEANFWAAVRERMQAEDYIDEPAAAPGQSPKMYTEAQVREIVAKAYTKCAIYILDEHRNHKAHGHFSDLAIDIAAPEPCSYCGQLRKVNTVCHECRVGIVDADLAAQRQADRYQLAMEVMQVLSEHGITCVWGGELSRRPSDTFIPALKAALTAHQQASERKLAELISDFFS